MTVTPVYLTKNASELWLINAAFDDLLLTGTSVDGAGNEFEIMAQAADADFGAPQAIDVAVQRWMADGAVASTLGHENREISFRVVITAETSAQLALGEAALARRSGPCLLKWTPSEGEGVAPSTIFEVWTWHLVNDFDIDRENRLSRSYLVTATAKPWARSEDLTTAAALTISSGVPVTTSIDNCSSTTNWTGSPNAPTTSAGTLVESAIASAGGGLGLLSLTRTASVTGLASTRYLVLDVKVNGASAVTYALQVDGAYLPSAGVLGTSHYWDLGAVASFTTLVLRAYYSPIHPGFPVALVLNDVSATDTVAGVGSFKQLTRSLDVGGSVPTSGSIAVVSPTGAALGTCLVHSCPGPTTYSPPLRQFRTAGNTVTADASCVSGNHEDLITSGASAGTITYVVPAANLPEATYAVVCRVLAGAAATMTLTVTTKLGSYAVSQTLVGTVVSTGAGAVWGVLGTVTLPPQAVAAGSTLNVTITLSGVATTGTHTLDEIYLLDVTNGAVTLVSAGSASRLWIDSPDADPVRNRPAIYLGTLDDRSDSAAPFYTSVLSVGDHDLDPEGMTLFTVTDGVDKAAVSAAYYRRWHTNAGS